MPDAPLSEIVRMVADRGAGASRVGSIVVQSTGAVPTASRAGEGERATATVWLRVRAPAPPWEGSA